jgi:hypothetical protein
MMRSHLRLTARGVGYCNVHQNDGLSREKRALTFCQLFFVRGELITKLETFALLLCDKVQQICVSDGERAGGIEESISVASKAEEVEK